MNLIYLGIIGGLLFLIFSLVTILMGIIDFISEKIGWVEIPLSKEEIANINNNSSTHFERNQQIEKTINSHHLSWKSFEYNNITNVLKIKLTR